MTVDNAGWSLLDRGGRLETLDRDECRRLLESTNIGRLGYCTDLGPRILPMNYTVVGESVTFRTGIDTEASQQLFDHPIALRSTSRRIPSDGMERSGPRKRAAARRGVIAPPRRRAVATALAGGQTGARCSTAADDDDRPSSPPVLEILGRSAAHDHPIQNRKTRLR